MDQYYVLTLAQLIDPKRKESIKQAKKAQERLQKLTVNLRRGVGADGRLVYPVTAQTVCDTLLKKHSERIPVESMKYPETAEPGASYAEIHLVEDIYARIFVTIEPR